MGRVEHLSALLAGRNESLVAHLLGEWRQARALRRTIQDLEALDDRALADIGLERSGIAAAARRAVGRL